MPFPATVFWVISALIYEPLITVLRTLMESKISFEERINLVDTFGLFKIADTLSASNKIVSLENPQVTKEKVKELIGRKVDERWKQQLERQKIGNIGLLRAYTG